MEQHTEPVDTEAWVPVEAGLFPQEAHIARGLLENEGIEVMLADENLAAVMPFLVETGPGARVCVRQRDLARAEALLKEADAGARTVTEDSEEAGTTEPTG